MKSCAFAAGIPQATIYDHLSFHYGQGIMMLYLGYRDSEDMDAGMVLSIYIQEMARRWNEQRRETKRLAQKYYEDGVLDDCSAWLGKSPAAIPSPE